MFVAIKTFYLKYVRISKFYYHCDIVYGTTSAFLSILSPRWHFLGYLRRSGIEVPADYFGRLPVSHPRSRSSLAAQDIKTSRPAEQGGTFTMDKSAAKMLLVQDRTQAL